MNKKNKTLFLLAILYAITWVGGWITYEIDIKATANKNYIAAQKGYQKMMEFSKELGLRVNDTIDHLHKNGPKAGVDFCFPILPCVLLADSYSSIGPRNGESGVKIVLYYGLGTKELFSIWGSIS